MFTNLFFIIVIGLFLLLLITFLLSYRKKMIAQNAQKEFDNFIFENRFQIEKEQTLHRNRIAIDKEHGKLIFVDKAKQPTQNMVIDLEEINSCKIVKTRNPKNGHISSISIQCDLKTTETPVQLCIYKENRDPMYKMMRLTKKAFYWVKTINLYKEMISKNEPDKHLV